MALAQGMPRPFSHRQERDQRAYWKLQVPIALHGGRTYIIIVKTPTTTSIQLNTTTIDVGFDTIMTVHTHPPTTHTGTLPQIDTACRAV